MFARFLKKDYWNLVGDVSGYISAVKRLDSHYHNIDICEQSYNDSYSVWGRLATLLDIPIKNTQNLRKWLYTVWKEDRRHVRTIFYAQITSNQPSEVANERSNNIMIKNVSHAPQESLKKIDTTNCSVYQESIDLQQARLKKTPIPLRVLHFTLTSEEWRAFFCHETWNVASDWTNKLELCLTRIGITCTIVFRKHALRAKNSRKKNCNFFTAKARCKRRLCPVEIAVIIEDEPKKKESPCVFTVHVMQNPTHDPIEDTAGRPVTGTARAQMTEHVKALGPLAVFERNVLLADENLLREGNLNRVPSVDVLKQMKQEYNQQYRLDEDIFKELRMFREFTDRFHRPWEDVSGFLQTVGEWPFTVHFFTETQLDRFADYCKVEKYSYLHIDATGSVVKRLKDQKKVFFYTMVFKNQETTSSILPLSGALLCDQSAASITSYFNCVRSKLAIRNKNARPSFVVIDFSPALLNSTLSSFNVENINNHLRRCSNTLDRAYDKTQLLNMTFVRICVNHAMKAFSRSLNKIEKSRQARRQLMSLFAILLNCTDVEGAFKLYEQIMSIYADPYAERSNSKLTLLLDTSDLNESDFEIFLKEDRADDEESPHFLDEIDITRDAIIHQSPFNVKACARIPVLDRLICKELLHREPNNPLYSSKIVHLFHKWFAYLPLWSCIMTGFLDRYAKDGSIISTDDWKFGYGRTSNAIVESYFAIIKIQILRKKTRLRPKDFLTDMYDHVLSRYKANQFSIAQSSRGRKSKRYQPDSLTVKETWARRSRSNSTPRPGQYFGDSVSRSNARRLSDRNGRKQKSRFDEAVINTTAAYSSANNQSISRSQSSSSNDSSSNVSFGFSNYPSLEQQNESEKVIISNSISSSPTPVIAQPPIINSKLDGMILPASAATVISSDTKDTKVNLDIRRSSRLRRPNSKYFDDYDSPTIISADSSRVVSPKRSHSPLDSNNSTTKLQTTGQQIRKRVKSSIPTHSVDIQQSGLKKQHFTTTVGTLKLTWPRYGIRDAVFEDNVYSVIQTCPLDTGLFAMYHAYKSSSDKFREIFENDFLSVYGSIRQTFQLVESSGWTVARLYWLVRHDLLSTKDSNGQYDIEGTLDQIVFQFVKTMQEYNINSECSCPVCPKRIRQSTSVDISITKINGSYPNFIQAFNTDRVGYCGANLGPTEPTDYPADIFFDDKHPVINLETNERTLEQRFICRASRTTSRQRFKRTVPFLIINVGINQSMMTELPHVLYISDKEYYLSAGFNNTNAHFTALIKTNTGSHVRFNDCHPRGCYPYDGLLNVDLALYILRI